MECKHCKFYDDYGICSLLAMDGGDGKFYDIVPDRNRDGCSFGQLKPSDIVYCHSCKYLADMPMRFECRNGYLPGPLRYSDYCSRGELRDKS